jgi:DNA-binding FrmR family transcriptional regulator
MSHTVREKTRLLIRVRRIRGQVEAVERAQQGIGCADVLQLITDARLAVSGEVGGVIDPALQPDRARGRRADRRDAVLSEIEAS